MKPFTFGSLFAGVGGFDIGLERAGMQCEWQVEIDPFCRKVLEKHWPNVKRYSDVRDCGQHNLSKVDLICGGFPCQDISNAGNRAGIDGERSGLWSEFARIIHELRPRYVIVENVAALLERGMGRVVGDLAASGYDAEWRVFSACEMGFSHSRERLFLIAYPTSARLERPFKPILNPVDIKIQDYQSPLLSTSDALRKGHGLSDWVDRITALGNAIVPQIPEWIGKQILNYESTK